MMALCGLVVNRVVSLLHIIPGWLTAGRPFGFATDSSLWVSRTSALHFLGLTATQTLVFGDKEGRWWKLQVNGILYSLVRGFHSRKRSQPPSVGDKAPFFFLGVVLAPYVDDDSC